MFTKKTLQLLSIVLFALVTVVIWALVLAPQGQHELRVSFLDVGQGDAIFIESPSGVQVLVDGGRGNAVVRELSRQMSLFDRSINMVVATHPDEDHIGGLADVLNRYHVATILRSGIVRDTPATNALESAIQNRGVDVQHARRGQEFDLGGGVRMTVLFPDRDISDIESIAGSIVIRIVHGEYEFLLTGDAPDEIERYVTLLDGDELASDVLKVGHHGSKTSSAEKFVGTVAPEYAVFSRGCDNRYGHPHEEVVARFEQFEVDIFDTCTHGTVTFVTDGEVLRMRKDR